MECNRCVMVRQGDPEFSVNEQGVCNYCQFADSKANERRTALLERPWVIHQIKRSGQGKEYDCLIGVSGGVDSSYALHLLKEAGVRPLAFTVDTGWNTKEADENIMRLVEDLKVPLYRYVINLEAFRALQKAFLMSGVPNIEIPTDHVLMAATYEMARKYNIKTIISGGNWQTEGTMPKSYGHNASDLTHIKAIAKRFGATTKGLPTISLLQYLWYRNVERIKVVNLLDYYDYHRETAVKILERKYWYQHYGEKHAESVFTKWFQNVYLYRKYGIDKRRPHLSSLIHSGQMTRAKAQFILGDKTEKMLAPSGFEGWATYVPHLHSDYPTNEKWVQRWSKFFNVLKRYGYYA